jgi:hypothetical protein
MRCLAVILAREFASSIASGEPPASALRVAQPRRGSLSACVDTSGQISAGGPAETSVEAFQATQVLDRVRDGRQRVGRQAGRARLELLRKRFLLAA